MIRVAVADDHPLLRQGILRMLSEVPDISVVGEASSGADTLRLLEHTRVDVLVLDLQMPDLSGFEVLGQLATWSKTPAVLILSAHPEDQFALRVLRAGARGYLTKASAPEELVRAIRKVNTGRRYVSDAVVDQLAGLTDTRRQEASIDALSPREFQVFRLIASGRRSGAVAQELGLSLSTVYSYRRIVLDKLGLQNDIEIARFAAERKLTE